MRTHLAQGVPLALFDPLLLEQVVINLVENAVRHAGPTSPIEITVRPDDESLLVEIADRGPGVPPGDEERVFEKFYRAPGAKQGDGGIGLGLTICRAIVMAHEGKIWFANRPEGGAVVLSSSPVILVIEDESNTRTLMQVTLAQGGYGCIHASTGIAGIAAAFDSAPIAILLDLGLPDLEALDSGANDYLTKPFGPAELLARIRVLLRNTAKPTEKAPETGMLTIGDLALDMDLRTVSVAGAEVHLTKIEFSLRATLMAAPGRVLNHQQLLSQVWGPRFATEVDYLRVYMTKLRHKIEREPARPQYLVSEQGIGYRLRLPTQSR